MKNERKFSEWIRIYGTLRELKSMAGSTNKVTITSSDLGKRLGVSQQSASRYLIGLIRDGYLIRSSDAVNHSFKISEKGLDLLHSEMYTLMQMLGTSPVIELSGKVVSGLGEGKYYVSRKKYIIQFQQKLGFIPYLGTLNIKVGQSGWDKLHRLRASQGIYIEGFKTEDRTFGAVKAFRSEVNGVPCAIIMPYRTVYTDTVEIISRFFLRDYLNISDGDVITVRIFL